MDNTQKGLTGEFYVLAQLIQRGLVATLTLANTKGVDILVSDPELNRLCKVEVKTTDRPPSRERLFSAEPCYHWAMGAKHERIAEANLFYCFVALRGSDELPRFFVVPSPYVAAYVGEQHRLWLGTRKGPQAETTMRRFRISPSDPLGFEGNWGVLSGAPIPECQLALNESWSCAGPENTDTPGEGGPL